MSKELKRRAMMLLTQPLYLDSNGRTFAAERVDSLATYVRKGDGFFVWQCGTCAEHNDRRSYELPQGVVYECPSCNSANLLLSSACDYVREALAFWEANKPRVRSGRYADLKPGEQPQ